LGGYETVERVNAYMQKTQNHRTAQYHYSNDGSKVGKKLSVGHADDFKVRREEIQIVENKSQEKRRKK